MKSVPFTLKQIQQLSQKYPTPFYIYDEEGIRQTVRKLIKSFEWAPGFKEYFAVKALPNPSILALLKEEGCGADCSSYPELLLAEKVGIKGEYIMFTSNDTAGYEFEKARELEAIINLDDISHIPFLEKHGGLPPVISFRYNPGPLKKGNTIIGNPAEAKYGLTRPQLFEAYKLMSKKGIKRFGLHTMVISNELHEDYFIDTARMLFDLVYEIYNKTGVKMEFINLGGGVGIPYREDQREVDIEYISKGIQKEYEARIVRNNLSPFRIMMECGRYITGPHGYLVAQVIHMKHTYRDYVGLDASMANLMRPGMYGAYHHITLMGKEKNSQTHVYDVTGSLCENNDKFALQRKLPKADIGDYVVIHDAGAHGHAMGFNYNGKLRSAEFLMNKKKEFKMIRRAETVDDYFATLTF